MKTQILEKQQDIISSLRYLSLDEKVEIINEIKLMLHEVSPFNSEPVDCVLWVKNETVFANDYNPNSVAPPEMELLRLSISNDGYTQPIVSMDNNDGTREVIDGFHRNRVGKECSDIQERVKGYLPVVTIRESQTGKNDRVASTIRHNRARGSHNVELMSTIVSELVEMGKGDRWICQHIGMSPDELLRLKQITGVAGLFSNREFSESWTVDDHEIEEFEDEDEQV